MARFFITNSDKAYKKARHICQNAGLVPNGFFTNKTGKGIVYDKRVISVDNFFSYNDGDAISVCGTALNNGGIENKKIASELKRSNKFNKIRDKITGHYGIIYQNNDEFTIITDKISTYSVYYYQDDSTWFISNNLSIIGQANDGVEIDDQGTIEKFLFKSNISPRTPFKKVSRLDGHSKLVAQFENIDIVQVSPSRESFGFDSFDEAVNKYSLRLDDIADRISESDLRSGLQLSGGLDSRTVLASLTSNNELPIAIVGKGGSIIDKSYQNDININDQIVKKLGLTQHYLNWSDNPLDRNESMLNDFFKKYGFNILYKNCNPNVFAEYEGKISPYPDILLLGYAPGHFNKKPWENYNEDKMYSVDKLIQDKSMYNLSNIVRNKNFKQHIVNSINERNDLDLQSELSGREIINKGFRINCWTSTSNTVNFLNEFTHTLCPLGVSETLLPLFTIPNNYREYKRFQLAIIHHLDEDLLDIPVRTKPKIPEIIYNKKIVNLHSTSRPSYKIFLDNVLKKSPNIFEDTMRSLYYTATNQSERKNEQNEKIELKNYYKNKINEYPVFDKMILDEVSGSNMMKLYLIQYATENALSS